MKSIVELNRKIEEVREKMNMLIGQKDEKLDDEVIIISKYLDILLNEYEEAMNEKNKHY